MTAEQRFHLAGLEVLLTSTTNPALPTGVGFYDDYPQHSEHCDLIIAIKVDPEMGKNGARGPGYPAFERHLTESGRVVLARLDARGEVELAPRGQPIRASFTVASGANSIDAVVRACVSIALPRQGGLVLHASAVSTGGQLLVFAGKSGAGKSTIAAMLAAGVAGVESFCDELLVATPMPAGTWMAHVTPFVGNAGQPACAPQPITAIHFLTQATHHRRIRLTVTEGLRQLMPNVLAHVADTDTAANVLNAASTLAARVPLYAVEFRKDLEVAGVLGIT